MHRVVASAVRGLVSCKMFSCISEQREGNLGPIFLEKSIFSINREIGIAFNNCDIAAGCCENNTAEVDRVWTSSLRCNNNNTQIEKAPNHPKSG